MGLIQPIGTLDRTITKTAIINHANDRANQIIKGGNYDLLKTYVEMKRNELYIITIVLSELIWGIHGMILFEPGPAVIRIVCIHISVLDPHRSLLENEAPEPRQGAASFLLSAFFFRVAAAFFAEAERSSGLREAEAAPPFLPPLCSGSLFSA